MHCVHVFRAAGWERAFERALVLGRAHEREYTNEAGERVRWRLVQVETLDIVQVPELDGAEVYSELVETGAGDAAAFDTTFHPERSRPAQTL